MSKNYSSLAKSYAEDCISGKIVACDWVKRACQRFINDLEKQIKDDYAYFYDEASGDMVCQFVELMPHIKGKWAGEGLKLEAWQIFIICNVWGWLRKDDGTRRFRTSYTEVARKNGKSSMSSPLGLYMAFADGEGGAEVYSAATNKDQAKIVFNDAQTMAKRSDNFRQAYNVDVSAHSVYCEATSSMFQAIASDDNSLDGKNIHFAIIDELHAHKTRGVYDVLETATGSRTQPLIWNITTAGSNRAGICYEIRTYLTKILENIIEDDTFFGIIYTLDKDDDWTSEDAWKKANPNYGVSVFPDDMQRLCQKAKEMPSAQNNFLTKRLNVWCNADAAWMNMIEWNACNLHDVNFDDFAGIPCWVGIDLATKNDVAAVEFLFYDGSMFHCKGLYFLPEDTVEERSLRTTAHYSGWAKEGKFILTPGKTISFEYIIEELEAILPKFDVRMIGYDPWQATMFAKEMESKGFKMYEYRNTVANMSEPMKQLEALILDRKLNHGGDKVLEWMISNVVAHIDKKDNIFPNKERAENKIDGVVALIMALGCKIYEEYEGESPISVYEERGMISI